jgi:hypothetical protein
MSGKESAWPGSTATLASVRRDRSAYERRWSSGGRTVGADAGTAEQSSPYLGPQGLARCLGAPGSLEVPPGLDFLIAGFLLRARRVRHFA